MIIEEKDLFDKLYKLYDETKDTSEPFTFWVKPRAKSGIFNGTQNTTYTNVGIVQIQSSYFREPFVGFRFRGNEVVLRIGKASEKTDVDKFINKAQKNNTLLTEDQIVMFLEEAQKQFESWKHSWSDINNDLIEKLHNAYNDFFSFVKKHDYDNSTDFYNVLKISNKMFEKNINANEELKNNQPSAEVQQAEDEKLKSGGQDISAKRGNQDGGENTKNPLNLILYGPPGTGKTYNTLFHALAIIENKKIDDLIGTYCPGKNSESNLSEDEYKKLKDEFDQKVNSGQIVFTTFHQSMSYEDFIEGIKPVVEGSEMTYKVQDGIFKQLCERAKICHWIDLFVQSVEGNNKIQLKTPTQGNTFEVWHEEDSESLSVKPKRSTAKDDTKISIVDHLKKYVLERNLEGSNNWPSYTPAIIDHIIKTYKNKEELKDSPCVYYPPYVLIIDEINRGNVAQIFGELITLIEPSKRLGNSEEMKAILPYSSAQKGEPVYFGVPNNLYIIGTMNTADRSVEALDTALRRRFSFKEMMPKPELLGEKKLCDVKLSDLLTTINQRIVALKDREHRIGHSYFMGLKTDSDLKDVFKDKIIPLLQEYFYGDYKKIYYVLGPGFVEKKTEKTIFAEENPDVYELGIPEERYDIVSFDDKFKFNIKEAIEKMKVKKLDSGAVTMSTEDAKAKTDEADESKESMDKK